MSPIRPSILAALALVASLGLAACDEPTVERDEVGSGDGPTEGAGSYNPSEPQRGEEAEGGARGTEGGG